MFQDKTQHTEHLCYGFQTILLIFSIDILSIISKNDRDYLKIYKLNSIYTRYMKNNSYF